MVGVGVYLKLRAREVNVLGHERPHDRAKLLEPVGVVVTLAGEKLLAVLGVFAAVVAKINLPESTPRISTLPEARDIEKRARPASPDTRTAASEKIFQPFTSGISKGSLRAVRRPCKT